MPKVETSLHTRGDSNIFGRHKREIARRVVKKLIRVEPVYQELNTSSINYYHPSNYTHLKINLNKHVDKSDEYLGQPSIPTNYHRKRVIIKKKRKPIEYTAENSNKRRKVIVTRKRVIKPTTIRGSFPFNFKSDSGENAISNEDYVIKPTRRVRVKKIKHTLNPISETFEFNNEITTNTPTTEAQLATTETSDENEVTSYEDDDEEDEYDEEEEEDDVYEDNGYTEEDDDEIQKPISQSLPDYEPFFPELTESLDAPILLLKTTVLSSIEFSTKTVVQSKLRTYTFVVTRVNGDEQYVTSTTEVKPHTKTVIVTEPTTIYTTLTLLDLDSTEILPFIPMTVIPSMESSQQPDIQGRSMDEARYNLATRVMSNGVEVIVAGDKSTLPGEPDVKRVLPSSIYKAITLKPSTLTNNMMMALPHDVSNIENLSSSLYPNQFVTKTCLTTFTYMTTYLENGTTAVSSHEQVVSNIATEERNTGKILPTPTMGITLTQYPNLATGTFVTTYTYLNTILDGEQPLVVTSKRTVTNTVTAPDDYLSIFQLEASAVKDTNTYYSTVALEKTLYEGKISKVISTNEVVTQVVITESVPPKGTSVMTSYILDVEDSQPPATEVTKTYFVTYTYYNTLVNNGQTTVHTNVSTSADVVTEKLFLNPKKTKGVINTTPLQKKKNKIEVDFNIYATKTYLTTFTYYTTLLQEENNKTATIISSHSRVVENIKTEVVEPHLLDKKILNSLKQEIKEHPTITKFATLKDGQKIEITVKNEIKPTKVLPIDKTQMPESIKAPPKIESSKPNVVTGSTIIFVDDFDDPFAQAIKSTPTQSKNALNSLLSSEIVKKPQRKRNKATIQPAKIDNNVKTTKPAGGGVSNLLASINIQALKPVLNAMAGLIQTNLKASRRNDSVATPTTTPTTPSNENRSPIYIPVGGLADIETAESQNIAKVIVGRPTHESPLLNGGIPISPGEVITANSDVIVGKMGRVGPRIPAIPLNHPVATEIPFGMKPPPPNKIWPKRHSEQQVSHPIIHAPNKDDYVGPPPPKSPVRPQNVVRGEKHKHIPLRLDDRVASNKRERRPDDIEYLPNKFALPEVIERSTGQPLLVNIQPSQVAFVNIPHNRTTALIYGGSTEPHINGQYFDDPSPYPEPEFSAVESYGNNGVHKFASIYNGGVNQKEVSGVIKVGTYPINVNPPSIPIGLDQIDIKPSRPTLNGVRVDSHVDNQNINVHVPPISFGMIHQGNDFNAHIINHEIPEAFNYHSHQGLNQLLQKEIVHPPRQQHKVSKPNEQASTPKQAPQKPYKATNKPQLPRQEHKNPYVHIEKVVPFKQSNTYYNTLSEKDLEPPPREQQQHNTNFNKNIFFSTQTEKEPTYKQLDKLQNVNTFIQVERNPATQSSNSYYQSIQSQQQEKEFSNQDYNVPQRNRVQTPAKHEIKIGTHFINFQSEMEAKPVPTLNPQNQIKHVDQVKEFTRHYAQTHGSNNAHGPNNQVSINHGSNNGHVYGSHNSNNAHGSNNAYGSNNSHNSNKAHSSNNAHNSNKVHGSNNVHSSNHGGSSNAQSSNSAHIQGSNNAHNVHGSNNLHGSNSVHVSNNIHSSSNNVHRHNIHVSNNANGAPNNAAVLNANYQIQPDIDLDHRVPAYKQPQYQDHKYYHNSNQGEITVVTYKPPAPEVENKPYHSIPNNIGPTEINLQLVPPQQQKPPKTQNYNQQNYNNRVVPSSQPVYNQNRVRPGAMLIPIYPGAKQNITISDEVVDHHQDDLENEAGEVVQESNERPLVPGQLPIEIIRANLTTTTQRPTTSKPNYNYIPHENEVVNFIPHIKQPRPFNNPVVRPENILTNQIITSDNQVLNRPVYIATTTERADTTTRASIFRLRVTNRPKVTSLPLDTRRITTKKPTNVGSQTEEPFKNNSTKSNQHVFNFGAADIPKVTSTTTRRPRTTTRRINRRTTTKLLQLNMGEVQGANITKNLEDVLRPPPLIESVTAQVPTKPPITTYKPLFSLSPELLPPKFNDEVVGMVPPRPVPSKNPTFSLDLTPPTPETKQPIALDMTPPSPPTTTTPTTTRRRRPTTQYRTTPYTIPTSRQKVTTQPPRKYEVEYRPPPTRKQEVQPPRKQEVQPPRKQEVEQEIQRVPPRKQEQYQTPPPRRQEEQPPRKQEYQTPPPRKQDVPPFRTQPPRKQEVEYQPPKKQEVEYQPPRKQEVNEPTKKEEVEIMRFEERPLVKEEVPALASKQPEPITEPTTTTTKRTTPRPLPDDIIEASENNLNLLNTLGYTPILPTGTVETVELEITPTLIKPNSTNRRRVVTSIFKRPLRKESILPTRYITHTKTSTVTITKTTVVKSLGAPPSTLTILITKTEMITMVDTVTEFHTLVKPTTIAETVTVNQQTSLYSSDATYGSYSIKPTQVHASEIEPTIIIESVGDDDLEDFIIKDTDPETDDVEPNGVDVGPPEDNESFFVVMTDKNQGSIIKIPKVKEDSRETQNRDEMLKSNEVNRVLLGGILIASPPSLETSVINDRCHPECKASRNELCQKSEGLMRCVCRPGFARMFPDRPCKPTYTYTMKIALERHSKQRLHYQDALSDVSTPEYIKLASATHDGLDRMVMQSDLRDIYHGVSVQGYAPINGSDGVVNTFNLQLSDNTDESRLKEVFKKYLRNNNYSLGGTDLYASRQTLDDLIADDFDECKDRQYHDCSEHSHCFNLRGTYTCSCKEGFADLSENILYPGRICSSELIGCEKCHYHGTCYSRGDEQILCECFQWYAGESCQVNLKVLLIALVTLGAILFTLLIICIVITCARRKPESHVINGMSFLPQRVPRHGTIDRRAMIQDTSSESGHSDTNTLPYVAKPKKLKGALKKPKPMPDPEQGGDNTLTYSDHQKDRSLTVMIPRAKYHPAPPTSPHHTSGASAGFDKRKNSAASSNEAKLLSYLDAGPSPNKVDQRKYSKTSDNFRGDGVSSRKTSGALISAGFEVSATVGINSMGTLGTIATTCGTEADRSENATLIQKISADLLSSTGTQSQFNTLRKSIADTEEDALENWLDITPRIQTISEARSYDETTIQPPTKSFRNDYDSKSSQQHQDEANTMAERDLGSTFLLPHTHLYKPDRGSDISGFESL